MGERDVRIESELARFPTREEVEKEINSTSQHLEQLIQAAQSGTSTLFRSLSDRASELEDLCARHEELLTMGNGQEGTEVLGAWQETEHRGVKRLAALLDGLAAAEFPGLPSMIERMERAEKKITQMDRVMEEQFKNERRERQQLDQVLSRRLEDEVLERVQICDKMDDELCSIRTVGSVRLNQAFTPQPSTPQRSALAPAHPASPCAHPASPCAHPASPCAQDTPRQNGCAVGTWQASPITAASLSPTLPTNKPKALVCTGATATNF